MDSIIRQNILKYSGNISEQINNQLSLWTPQSLLHAIENIKEKLGEA